MHKDEIRRQLEEQCRKFKEEQGGNVTLYAGNSKPDRKPWKKRPTPGDMAYQQALAEAEKGTDQQG
jgi:hypothetical protein